MMIKTVRKKQPCFPEFTAQTLMWLGHNKHATSLQTICTSVKFTDSWQYWLYILVTKVYNLG